MKYECAKPKAARIEVESILTVSDRLRINIFISPFIQAAIECKERQCKGERDSVYRKGRSTIYSSMFIFNSVEKHLSFINIIKSVK